MPELIAGKYEVLETIGRGGMGMVYKGHQKNLDRTVAIKMLSEELASDDEFRARFQQEATIVARLSHPNIVAIYDIEPYNHTFCLIMEYLEGETLQQKIDRDLTVPERDALNVGAQIARALHYAHQHGIIHRDIKPDNIHISRTGVAKVMDFGIARFKESKLKTQTGISMGTPKFMSPEQVTGKGVDGQTDLYSLGVCLYTALAGRVPFDGENAIAIATRHLYEPPEPPSQFNTAITPATEKVVLRALEKSKAERYKTGNEMATALETALNARAPIRLGDESNYRAAVANATERLNVSPVPGVRLGSSSGLYPRTSPASASEGGRIDSPAGGVAVAEAVDSEIASETGNAEANSESDSWGQAGGRNPTTPARFDDSFTYTPSRRNNEPDFLRRNWLLLTIIVLVLAAGIASYVAATRSPKVDAKGGGIGSDPNPAGASQSAQEYRELQTSTEKLTRDKRIPDALKAWRKFQTDRPGFKSAQVSDNIDLLESKLPLSEKEQLSRRRQRKGEKFYEDQAKRNALAIAYLQAAADLGGSKLTSSILNLAGERRPKADPAQAATALQLAREKGQAGDSAAVEKALHDAVCFNPDDAAAWKELGDFYKSRGYTDDARVAYRTAMGNATGGAAEFDTLLRELDSQ